MLPPVRKVNIDAIGPELNDAASASLARSCPCLGASKHSDKGSDAKHPPGTGTQFKAPRHFRLQSRDTSLSEVGYPWSVT